MQQSDKTLSACFGQPDAANHPPRRHRAQTETQRPMHRVQCVFAVPACYSVNLERLTRALMVPARPIGLGHGKPTINILPGRALQTGGPEMPGPHWPTGALENGAKQGNVVYSSRRMLSHKTKYALKALFVMSEEYGRGPMLISEVAERGNIPKRFLELILLELKNHGILRSKKGKGGGYTLSRPPDQISVGHVIRMLEGPLAPLPCASKTAYEKCEDCRDEKTCGVRLLMKEVRDQTATILDSTSLADMLKLSRSAKSSKGHRAAMLAV